MSSEYDCGHCTGTSLDEDDGVQYCTDCGVVLSQGRLEYSEPQWVDPSDRRMGPAQSHQWVSTGSCIGYGSGADSTQGRMGRLRQYDSRLRGTEQSLVSGLRELRGLCAALEFPESLREAAAYRFRQAAEADLLKGRSVEAIAAASVLVAARRQEFPLTVAQLADHSPIEGDAITGSYSVLVREFSLKLLPPHPRDHLPRLSSQLSLSSDLQREATKLLERADETGFHIGKRPTAVAAAVCYTVAAHNGRELTQSTVADVADVSVVTISRHHQRLSALLTEVAEES